MAPRIAFAATMVTIITVYPASSVAGAHLRLGSSKPRNVVPLRSRSPWSRGGEGLPAPRQWRRAEYRHRTRQAHSNAVGMPDVICPGRGSSVAAVLPWRSDGATRDELLVSAVTVRSPSVFLRLARAWLPFAHPAQHLLSRGRAPSKHAFGPWKVDVHSNAKRRGDTRSASSSFARAKQSFGRHEPRTGTRLDQLSFDHGERQPTVLKARSDRFSSDAPTETHDVKILRQLRTSVATSDGGALRRMLARSAVVYQTLVSVSAQAPWDHELGLKPIRSVVDTFVRSDGPRALVLCSRTTLKPLDD